MDNNHKKLLINSIDTYNRAVQRRNGIQDFSEQNLHLNSALATFSNSLIMQAHDHMLEIMEKTRPAL